MNFKPLTTLDELKSAQAAGLRVEYSATLADSVDMPACELPRSGGWIIPRASSERHLARGIGQLRVEVPAQRYPDDALAKLVEALRTVRIGCETSEREAEARYGKNWRNEVIDAALANLEPKS